jgi:hypothetical protein
VISPLEAYGGYDSVMASPLFSLAFKKDIDAESALTVVIELLFRGLLLFRSGCLYVFLKKLWRQMAVWTVRR